MHIVIGIVIIALIALGAVFFTRTPAEEEPANTTPPTEQQVEVEDNRPEEPVGAFEDGTYTAEASYFTPRRTQHDIDVTLTIADGVVTDANVLYDGKEASTSSHTRFDGAYRAEVVGKRLENISLSRTGGASLTATSFNEALEDIKTQAS